jgi:hypothetical protein
MGKINRAVKMIDFVNAVSFQFVLLVAVVLAAPLVVFIGFNASKAGHEIRVFRHTETMTQNKNLNEQQLLRIRSNDPKMIEGVSRE